jgi:hypothetical protein
MTLTYYSRSSDLLTCPSLRARQAVSAPRSPPFDVLTHSFPLRSVRRWSSLVPSLRCTDLLYHPTICYWYWQDVSTLICFVLFRVLIGLFSLSSPERECQSLAPFFDVLTRPSSHALQLVSAPR